MSLSLSQLLVNEEVEKETPINSRATNDSELQRPCLAISNSGLCIVNCSEPVPIIHFVWMEEWYEVKEFLNDEAVKIEVYSFSNCSGYAVYNTDPNQHTPTPTNLSSDCVVIQLPMLLSIWNQNEDMVVYKGTLENGYLVAVKVLKGLIGSGEEFINEVATISRISHVNIVTLLGFCFEGLNRALICEFMPDGSLEKFICDRNSLTFHQMGWEALYRIVVGIARGLEYLHRGCNI
ncbi:hypothetical protein ACSBR1_006192 [Camellia fascicularis]